MILESRVPSGILSNYIENIVFYKDLAPGYAMEKLLPDGSIFVLIDMQDGPKKLYHNDDLSKFTEFSECYVSGQHKGFIHIEVTPNPSMMVIKFLPGGASPFFNFPISRLNDRVQQLGQFWGEEIGRVRESIIAEETVDGKYALIENFLLAKLDLQRTHKTLDIALEALRSDPFKVTTKELALKAGVSQKHLISLFDKHVGLTPKYLARIYRFQKVLLLLEEKKKTDWLQIAYDCGYYDQAHFVKDFYSFSGINPTTYLDQKGEYVNYIPVK